MCKDCSKCEYFKKIMSIRKNLRDFPFNCVNVLLESFREECYSALRDRLILSDCAPAVGQMIYLLRSSADFLDRVLEKELYKDYDK